MKTKKYLIPILMSLVTACSFFTPEKKAESDVKSLGGSDDVLREMQNLATPSRKLTKQGSLNSELFGKGLLANKNFQKNLREFEELNDRRFNERLKALGIELKPFELSKETKASSDYLKKAAQDARAQRIDIIEENDRVMDEFADILKKTKGVIPIEDRETQKIVRKFELTNDQYQSGLKRFNSQLAGIEVYRGEYISKDINGYYQYIGEGANAYIEISGMNMTLKNHIINMRKIAAEKLKNTFTKFLNESNYYLGKFLIGELKSNSAFLEVTQYLE